MITLRRAGLLVALVLVGLFGVLPGLDTSTPGGTDVICLGGKNPPYTSVTVCTPVAVAVD